MTRPPPDIDRAAAQTCLAHLRAAARICEDAGMLAAWATILGVADELRTASERREVDPD